MENILGGAPYFGGPTEHRVRHFSSWDCTRRGGDVRDAHPRTCPCDRKKLTWVPCCLQRYVSRYPIAVEKNAVMIAAAWLRSAPARPKREK